MELSALRRNLHMHPELSGMETRTADILKQFLSERNPHQLVTDIGGHGLLAVYQGASPGKTVLLRCDIDAVPVNENSMLSYSSRNPGVSHKCGHDGHMAILAGVADHLHRHPLTSGSVLLLFQPAEETGQGAAAVLTDPSFNVFKPDMVFALHNLPGFPEGSVITSDSSFACTSMGMELHITGKGSHAAEPEKGNSPAPAIAELIRDFQKLNNRDKGELATVTHISAGIPSLGVLPETALFMAVLRAPTSRQMDSLQSRAEQLIKLISEEASLIAELQWKEVFPATVNDPGMNLLVQRAAINRGIPFFSLESPFPWSEDFGYFTAKYPGALFGLGAGEECPALHSSFYDFPEEIIEAGRSIFLELLEVIL